MNTCASTMSVLLFVAAACATAAAGAIDGPCTMRSVPEVTKGEYCPEPFMKCVSRVSLAPSNSTAVAVTLGSDDCFSGDPMTYIGDTSATIVLTTEHGSLIIVGQSSAYGAPKGFTQFQLWNLSQPHDQVRAPVCSGFFAVDSGVCLLSDQGRDPPGPGAKGPCTMDLEYAAGECASVLPCVQKVRLSPGPGPVQLSALDVALSGECAAPQVQLSPEPLGIAELSFQTEMNSTRGQLIIFNSQNNDRGTLQFIWYKSNNIYEQKFCDGTMRMTQGECLYSNRGPPPTTDPVLVGPCSMQLQSTNGTCSAELTTCLSHVEVSQLPEGGALVRMSPDGPNNVSCFDGHTQSLIKNGVAALTAKQALPSHDNAIFYGGQAMAPGLVHFGMSIRTKQNGDVVPATSPANGSWSLSPERFPCQAVLKVTSGTCLFSDKQPAGATATPAPSTPVPAAASAVALSGQGLQLMVSAGLALLLGLHVDGGAGI